MRRVRPQVEAAILSLRAQRRWQRLFRAQRPAGGGREGRCHGMAVALSGRGHQLIQWSVSPRPSAIQCRSMPSECRRSSSDGVRPPPASQHSCGQKAQYAATQKRASSASNLRHGIRHYRRVQATGRAVEGRSRRAFAVVIGRTDSPLSSQRPCLWSGSLV